MASQQQLKKRLKALMNRPENQVCSDCPERQPRWASLIVPPQGSPPGSLPIGAFCCLECSGSHRRLGVHISFVRSINLDSWKEREVQAMENGGNKKVNAIFEAKLGPYTDGKKPTTGASGPERERFIRDKYERRKYYDASVLQRYYDDASDEESESEDEAPSRKSKTKAVVRAPSDAARRRAEARRARQEATQSSGASRKVISPKRPAASRPPAPAPAPEVDLLNFDAVPAAPDPPIEPSQSTPSASPKLDLFANMGISNGGVQNASDAATSAVQQKMLSDQRKQKNNEILAMFNPNQQQQPQQTPQAFGDFGAFNNAPTVAIPGGQNMNTGGGAMMNNPNSGIMMMGGFPQQMPQQGGAVAMQQNAQGRNMMMMQNNKGNTTMMMQQRSDSGTFNTMMMQQQQQQMGGMGMNQQGMPMGMGGMNQQAMPMGGGVNQQGMPMGGMGGMGMGMGMNPQQQQLNMMGNQMPMGGMPSTGGNQLMGGQPMGVQPMPGQMMGGQPMGSQTMASPMGPPAVGGNERKSQPDQFSEFSPW
mmetsp:Transcript_58605/g.174467  ORF Transcript_58605/g.174467 Transcript_58605/m.174467 type:complete len:534 (-) Transcript_58605:306-1907(-)|eukprot:CAMPEP_0113587248 /NCGR_PEP_ID=MMETSP0015_2-20120614/34787_1 /TAXON_ID=2838 /ORGANISM="Odontella" /LENGTH=533 /DNA_ID=CAMNT_0000492855 /DNA_START=469 /DNA_END=2070 /DNA_ORIENTATION=- /assembly_acc=CAM_ASM_000160